MIMLDELAYSGVLYCANYFQILGLLSPVRVCE